MQSDRELIDAINAGDADAFERLYLRYRDWVYRLAWRFTANHEDALDVLQDTFAYLLKKFPGFVLTASMTTFLYPVVKRIALNLRARRSPGHVGDDVLDIPLNTVKSCLYNALRTLRDDPRTRDYFLGE